MQQCWTKSKSLLFVRLASDQMIRRETFLNFSCLKLKFSIFIAAAATWTFKSRLSGTNYTTQRPTLAPVVVGSYRTGLYWIKSNHSLIKTFNHGWSLLKMFFLAGVVHWRCSCIRSYQIVLYHMLSYHICMENITWWLEFIEGITGIIIVSYRVMKFIKGVYVSHHLVVAYIS